MGVCRLQDVGGTPGRVPLCLHPGEGGSRPGWCGGSCWPGGVGVAKGAGQGGYMWQRDVLGDTQQHQDGFGQTRGGPPGLVHAPPEI